MSCKTSNTCLEKTKYLGDFEKHITPDFPKKCYGSTPLLVQICLSKFVEALVLLLATLDYYRSSVQENPFLHSHIFLVYTLMSSCTDPILVMKQ